MRATCSWGEEEGGGGADVGATKWAALRAAAARRRSASHLRTQFSGSSAHLAPTASSQRVLDAARSAWRAGEVCGARTAAAPPTATARRSRQAAAVARASFAVMTALRLHCTTRERLQSSRWAALGLLLLWSAQHAAFRAFTPRAVLCRHSSHPSQPTNIARPTFALGASLCSSLPREPGSMASFFDFSEFDFAAATADRGAERG